MSIKITPKELSESSNQQVSPSSYFHRGGDQQLLGQTISQRFMEIVNRFPDHEAVVDVILDRRLTYRELLQKSDGLALGLLALGFQKGDRLGIWATDNIEWILLQMATARIGILLVNINPAYRTVELEYALRRSEVQGLFCIPSFRKSNYINMLLELIPELNNGGANPNSDKLQSEKFPHLRNIVVYDPQDWRTTENTKRPAAGFTLWKEVIDKGEEQSFEQLENIAKELDMDDPINIQYTSGTTGFPKAVTLTHHNILNNAYFSAKALEFSERDRLCVPVPFYHCFGMVLANLLCLATGACIVIPAEHFDALKVLEAIEKEKCTGLHGVPTMFIAQLEHPKFQEFNLSTLRAGIMAGAPCPPPLMKKVMEDMHMKNILIGYGQTEASPITHLTKIGDSMQRRTETVGKNLDHQEVKIVDHDTGKIVALGVTGEVCFRGYHIMKGYYNDPEATAKAIDEHGWLHSGDLGSMDKEGYVKITGRLKDMIIRGGENIYPKEIEEFLFGHPKIAQAAVFGVPDDYYGEEVAVWIQLHADESATEDEITEYCKEKIAHYKIPKRIWFVDQFPMTVTGKLQKFRIREMAIEQMKKESK